MARADIINILYSRNRSPLEFKFDSLFIPPLFNYITIDDRDKIYQLVTSIRYASKIDYKYKEIDKIMRNRGFKKFHAGTNRVVYSFLEDQSFVLKIAIDQVGMQDNPLEYRNQMLLKPFVTKIFDVDPSGTIASVERVQPILSIEEFALIGEDVFDLLNRCILGKYVIDDIGIKAFMNYGIRNGYGPVLLDYPYVYELDENKIFCNKILDNGQICKGEIDYQEDFNRIICTKCGKPYAARELEKKIKEKEIILQGENDYKFNIKLKSGDNILKDFSDNIYETETIINNKRK